MRAATRWPRWGQNGDGGGDEGGGGCEGSGPEGIGGNGGEGGSKGGGEGGAAATEEAARAAAEARAVEGNVQPKLPPNLGELNVGPSTTPPLSGGVVLGPGASRSLHSCVAPDHLAGVHIRWPVPRLP